MRMKSIAAAVMAGCVAVVIAAAPGFAAQAHDPKHAATDQAKPAPGMAAKDHAMMAERAKMLAEMKAADQRLTDLVARMHGAAGAEKTAATAAAVTELVAQSRSMRDSMMKMQQGMMPHMMEHMQEGQDSMAMCPMMKPMGALEQ